MSDKIEVILSTPSLRVNVGEFATLIITIRNKGQFVDEFAIKIEGLEPSWYDLSATDVLLPPAHEGQVRVIVHPSKAARVRGGGYPFKVKISSMVDAAVYTTVDASLLVYTFAGFSAEMSSAPAVGRGGTYIITLHNESKKDITGRLEATDPADELDFSFDAEEFRLPAGVDFITRLYVLPKDWALVKADKEYSFQVLVKPSGEGESSAQAVVLNGHMLYRPKVWATPPVREVEAFDRIGVALSSTSLKARIGEFTELIVMIRNSTKLVDQFSIAIEGLNAGWYDFSAADVLLSPGDEGRIRAIIHPPKAADVKAGSYPFRVKVSSIVDTMVATVVEASLMVYTFAGLSAEMSLVEVVGRVGTYSITLSNQSKAGITEGFTASDPGDELAYTFTPREVYIPPGGKANVELCVQPREGVLRQDLGELRKVKEYSFQVEVKPITAAGSAFETMQLNGQVIYRPTYQVLHKIKLGAPSLPKFKLARPTRPKVKPAIPPPPRVEPEAPAVPRFEPPAPAPPRVKPEAPAVPRFEPPAPAPPRVKPEAPAVPRFEPPAPAPPRVKPEAPAVPRFEPPAPAPPRVKPEVPAVPSKFRPAVPEAPAAKRGAPAFPRLAVSPRMVGAVAAAIVLVASSVLLYTRGPAFPSVVAFAYEPAKDGYTLSWDVTGATKVRVAGELVDSGTGTIVVRPVERTEYVLVATSEKGEVNASVVIQPPPTIDFFQAELVTGGFLVSWSVKGADKVYLNERLVDPQGEKKFSTEEFTRYTLSARNSVGMKEQNITVVPPGGEVRLLTPERGAQIAANSEYYITWNSSGVGIDHAGIHLSAEALNWKVSGNMVSSCPDSGSYRWIVPDYLDASCTVTVAIYDSAGNVLDEAASPPFRITGGKI
jgi:hypothetical protein